jgi:ketosteroid isomerase-like protein
MHILFATLLLMMAPSSGTQASTAQNDALRTIQTFVRANETANLELMLSAFDENATVFFPEGGDLPPSRVSGKAQIRSTFEALFRLRTGPIRITPQDIVVQAFGDVVIATLHLRDLPVQPVQVPVAFPRRTFVLHRIGDRWLIVHHHASNVQISPSSK